MDPEKKIGHAFEDLTHSEAHRRSSAVIAIGECQRVFGLPPKLEYFQAIVPLLRDENWHVRFYAAQALGTLGFGEARQPLCELQATEEDARVRGGIEKALDKLPRDGGDTE